MVLCWRDDPEPRPNRDTPETIEEVRRLMRRGLKNFLSEEDAPPSPADQKAENQEASRRLLDNFEW